MLTGKEFIDIFKDYRDIEILRYTVRLTILCLRIYPNISVSLWKGRNASDASDRYRFIMFKSINNYALTDQILICEPKYGFKSDIDSSRFDSIADGLGHMRIDQNIEKIVIDRFMRETLLSDKIYIKKKYDLK